MLYMEITEQQSTRIENGSGWSNGTEDFDRTGPTEKSDPPQKVRGTVYFTILHLVNIVTTSLVERQVSRGVLDVMSYIITVL